MGFTALPLAAEIVTAAKLSALITEVRPIAVIKSADETVNNSATLQNDDQLFASVVAGVVYDMILRLIVNTNATADFKAQFTGPASTFITAHVFVGSNPDTAAAGLQGPFNLLAPAAVSGVGADQVLVFQGLVSVITSGTLQLQWAQNTANASNTIVKSNSYLILRQV